jgi:hypothetical protein
MKTRRTIDFDQLERLAAAGATAPVIIEVLRTQEGKKARKKPRQRKPTPTNANQHEATVTNTNQLEPTPSQIAERELFKLGRQVFGKNGGGLTTNLLKHHRYDFAVTRAVIETAATKADPREYVMGLLRKVAGNGAIDPTMAAFDRLISQTEGGEVEGNPPMRDVTPRRA